jgi:hypothetical protein
MDNTTYRRNKFFIGPQWPRDDTSKPAFLDPNRDDAVWQKVVKARRLYQLAVLNDWRFVLLHSRQKGITSAQPT